MIKMDPAIEKVVKLYRKNFPEYGESEWHGFCFEACIEFQELLLDADIIQAEDFESAWDIENLEQPQYSVKHPRLSKDTDHWVFRLGNLYFDWSLRQFPGLHNAPFPLVWSR